MKLLKAGGAYYGMFITSRADTMVATDADTLPVATATRNGTDDASFVLTVAKIDTGRYKITGTIPAYSAGDQVQISVAAAVNAVAGKGIVDDFVVVGGRPGIDDIPIEDAVVADKTGFSLLQTFPSNFASLLISSAGKVTVGTNDDKSGYALTSALTAQNVWEYATRALTDKAGFALATVPPTAAEVRQEIDAHSTKLDVAVSTRATLGAGGIVWTYTLTNANTHLPIADADIWATTDAAGVNVIASGRTNQYGIVTFMLDAGTVYIWRKKAGENFVDPDIEVVAA